MHRRLTILVSVLTLVAVGLSLPAFAQAKEYAGTSACKMCHNKPAEGAQWTQWSTSDHAKAMQTLKGDKAKPVADKLGLKVAPSENPDCLRCHVTGYDKTAKKAPEKINMEEGVGCETCHGPGGAHVAAAKKYMMDKTLPSPASLIVAKPDEKVCTGCHNSENPTWDANKFTLPDGKKAGFDFKQCSAKIAHPNPKKAAGAAAPAPAAK